MERACTCNNIPPPGEPFTDRHCALCWMWHRQPEYRKEVEAIQKAEHFGSLTIQPGRPGLKLKTMLAKMGFRTCGKCAMFADKMDAWGVAGCLEHRDEIIEHLRHQEKSAGVMEKLRAGGLAVWNGLPLTAEGLTDEAIRQAREDEQAGDMPYTSATVRHLAYHIAPFRGNGIWQRNVRQLKQRLRLFNGRRVVGIVTEPTMDSPEAVRAMLGDDVEYLVVRNAPHLREVATFVPLLERTLHYAGVNDLTFYAHSKGVTRPVNPGVTVHYWTDLMYQTCLDYVPLVERLLIRHATAGTFKKVGAGFQGSASAWHWSGSFFWLRNIRTAGRSWRHVDQQWWGNESWVGLHFRPHEAAALLISGRVPTLDLYDMKYLKNVAMPAYVKFKQNHAGERVVHES